MTYANLLITSDLNLILNDFLNFKLFEIYIPRYNLFPIFIWFDHLAEYFQRLPS